MPQNVAAYRDRFILTDSFQEILPGIFLVPHNTENLARIGERSGLYKSQNGQVLPDGFAHEQSLVIDTDDGLVIFNSCSHAGAANIIREVREACNQKKVLAYVGGLHMKGKENGQETCTFSASEIDALCDAFTREGIARIYTGHCTGTPGFEELQRRLSERVHRLTTGLRFEI